MSDAPVTPPERTADSLWRGEVAQWFNQQFRCNLVSVQIPEGEGQHAKRMMEALNKLDPLPIILAALGDPEPIEVAEVKCERAVAAHLTQLLHSLGGDHLSVAGLRLDKPFTPLRLWWGEICVHDTKERHWGWFERKPGTSTFGYSQNIGLAIAATYLNLPEDDALVLTAAKPLTAWLEQQGAGWVLTGDDVGRLLEKVD